MTHLRTAWKQLVFGSLFLGGLFCVPQFALAGASDAPPGPITNTASATYQDTSGNTYTTTSNTATTYVQNAPGISVVANAGTKIAQGQTGVADTFSIQNTGNGTAILSLPASGGSATSVNNGTIGSGPTSSASCGTGASQYKLVISATTTYCDNVTDLNTFLAAQNISAGTTITLTVYYTASTPLAAGSTAGATITPTFTQAAQTGVASASATASAATVTDTIVAPRLDTYKKSSVGSGQITYTIYAHNGGNGDAVDVKSAGTLLGAGSNGVLISDEIPVVSGSPLANTGTVTVATNSANGFPAGATVDVWYSTTAGGGAGTWTKAAGSLPTYTGIPNNATYIALFVHGGTCTSSGQDLCSDTTHVTSPGNSNVATNPAISFSFVVTSPPGGQTATNIANSISVDLAGNIVGPGISSGTADASNGGLISGGTSGINNTSVTSSTTGASNQTSDSIVASDIPQNGPLGNAAATGSYDYISAGSPGVSNDANHDFTAVGFTATGDSPVNTNSTYATNDLGAGAGAPASTTVTSGAVSLCIGHSVYNNGNRADTYTIAVGGSAGAVPVQQFGAFANSGGVNVGAGWTVGVYSDSTCTSAYGGSTQGTSTSASTGSVAVGNSVNYYVKYVIPAGTTYFNRYDALVRATSTNNATVTDDTHDELYAGFVAMAKKIASVTRGGVAGCSATGNTQVCPGDTINYKLEYESLVIGTTSASYQSVSFSQAETKVGTFQITDDGAGGTNTWAANTNGLTGAVADTNSAGASRASTTFVYTPGPGAATATKFVGTIGGASFQLTPLTLTVGANNDYTGYLTFSVVVK